MALIWADSFDHYGSIANMLLGAYSAVDSDFSISTSQKRTGTSSLRLTPSFGEAYVRRSLGVAKTTVGFGLGLYCNNLPADDRYRISFLTNALAEVVTMRLNPTGQLVFMRGATTLAISDPIIVSASFQHIEIKVIRDNVVGEIEVRVDGEVVIHNTGLNLGTVDISNIVWGKYATGSDSNSFFFDDIFAWDTTGSYNNSFMGPQRVYTTFCDADTAVEDWTTTGAADAYQAVNNVPQDGDTTYIESSTATDKIELELPALPPEVATIAAVFVQTLGKLTAAGVGNVQTSIVNGVAAASGPDQVLTTSYVYWPAVFAINPTTSAPFTKSQFEASKIRLEKTV